MKDKLTPKMVVALCFDAAVALFAMVGAISLRYRMVGSEPEWRLAFLTGLAYAVITVAVFLFRGNYRTVWRFTGFEDIIRLANALVLATLLVFPLIFIFNRLEGFPRAALIIQWPIAFFTMAGARILWRLANDGELHSSFAREDVSQCPILLAGPSERMMAFLREAQRLGARGFPYRVVGLIDSDPAQVGHEIRGKRVLGHVGNVGPVLTFLATKKEMPEKLVLVGGLNGGAVRTLFDACQAYDVKLARSPRLTDLQVSDGSIPVDVRPIDLLDLLGRPQVKLDSEAMKRLIADKRVVVTGAGGTIGSELARQIAALQPSFLAILDSSEFNLYQIDLELSELAPQIPRRAVLADVRDRDRIDQIFGELKPQTVFHAAALKHVPIVETYAADGVKTNVDGSINVADASTKYGAGVMVLVSTDKAVNPSSVMGATKRVAEIYCQALARAQRGTRFVTVRFGNVIGSTGSVVPLFQRQIAKGGPVTVTDKEMTRYFMTTREAVELVLMAAALPPHEEDRGRIHVLDMGEPVKIYDLACNMIRMAGYVPDKDISIRITGIRPGEKLHEALFHDLEQFGRTEFKGILLANARAGDLAQLKPVLAKLSAAAAKQDDEEVRRFLRVLVPEYHSPAEESNGTVQADRGVGEAVAEGEAVARTGVPSNVRSIHS